MNTTQENLKKALDLLDGGNRWIKGHLKRTVILTFDGDDIQTSTGYCAFGASCDAVGDDGYTRINIPEARALRRAIMDIGEFAPAGYSDPGVIETFNDHPRTQFRDIEKAFEKAIEIAGEQK